MISFWTHLHMCHCRAYTVERKVQTGPLYSSYSSCEVCANVQSVPHRRCVGSHSLSASQTLLPWAQRPPAAEPVSRRSEGIIRESVCVCKHVLLLVHVPSLKKCTHSHIWELLSYLHVWNITCIILKRVHEWDQQNTTALDLRWDMPGSEQRALALSESSVTVTITKETQNTKQSRVSCGPGGLSREKQDQSQYQGSRTCTMLCYFQEVHGYAPLQQTVSPDM